MIDMTARAALETATLLAGWIEGVLSGEINAPPRLALQIQRTHRPFAEIAGDLISQEDAILRRHGALEDEQGFVPRTVDGKEEPGTFNIEDEEQFAAANAARAELWSTEVEIDASPLPLDELLAAGFPLNGRQALTTAALFEDHAYTGD